MMNILKKIKIHYNLLILITLLIFYNPIINILSYINIVTSKENNNTITENNILKRENKYLKEELSNITNLNNFASYNYSLTRLCYKELYNSNNIIIFGGKDKNYKKDMPVINEKGLIGIISEINNNTSKVNLLIDIKDFSVIINNSYGSIKKYNNNLFIVDNISNYDNIHINDEVYTSTLGNIHESLYIGYVYKIDTKSKNKEIYIKSKVDFNNLNYLYVVGV